jgi:asparagine synthase (glutamine-hydrolysing)
MCGISGLFSNTPTDFNLLDATLQMSRRLRHRGPDDEGVVAFYREKDSLALSTDDSDEEVITSQIKYCPKHHYSKAENDKLIGCFAHRRLSIIDLSPAGHQPMCDASGRYWITYNGEVYNYRELRQELQSAGIIFHSESDTEVVLKSYIKWGRDCLVKFNGMFAFAVFDTQSNVLFAARDRVGVKPLYFVRKPGVFAFASEQKALMQLPFVSFSVNNKAVHDFFFFNRIESQREGFFKDLEELMPAEYLMYNLRTDELTINKYFSPGFRINDNWSANPEQTTEQFAQTLEHAVRLRLRSDVKVGSCLSGGLDSSAIVHLMNYCKENQDPIELFTAVFPGQSFDESDYAKAVADSVNSHWHQVETNEQGLLQSLNDLIFSQDIPLWSTSTFAQFSVMKRAADEGIKVLLDGQGGDEMLGGYFSHYNYLWKGLMQDNRFNRVREEWKSCTAIGHPLAFYLKQNIKNKLSQTLSIQNNIRLMRSYRSDLNWLTDDFSFDSANFSESMKEPENLQEILLHEYFGIRLKGYLKCEDRCSMWHSVEARTPLADDVPLMNLAFTLPDDFKINKSVTKAILRNAMKDKLPTRIINRKDKMGYVTPNAEWLTAIKDHILPIITDGTESYFKKERIEKEFHQALSQSNNLDDTRIFKFVSFALWMKLYKAN